LIGEKKRKEGAAFEKKNGGRIVGIQEEVVEKKKVNGHEGEGLEKECVTSSLPGLGGEARGWAKVMKKEKDIG